jgi:hypothetical protein
MNITKSLRERHPMKTMTLRTARYAFVSMMTALTVFTVAESVVGGKAEAARVAEGLSTCGSQAQPCVLETLAVSVDAPAPAAVQVAEGLSECGSEAAPCQLETLRVIAEPPNGHLASADRRSLGMTLRVKS